MSGCVDLKDFHQLFAQPAVIIFDNECTFFLIMDVGM